MLRLIKLMLFRFVLLALCFIPPAYSNTLSEFNRAFSVKVKTELAQHNIPGAAYVVIHKDKVSALETYGYVDQAKSKKVTADTVFRLASVSKTFAATLTTMLAQDNLLNLSDPITQYVPAFALSKKGQADNIQLKHILSHSSGLMPNTYDNLLHENWSMDKIIGRFDKLTPICPPEKCYGYQNVLYGFLQPAIEARQDKSYSQLLQEKLFTPLNMVNTSVGYNAFMMAENTAKPHVLINKIKTPRKNLQGQFIYKYVWRKVAVEPDFYKVETAAGINASISDLAKWLMANMGYQPEVLPSGLVAELITPRIKTKKDLRRKFWRKHLTDAHYGYGWRIYQLDNTSIIYHSGWVAGFRADIGYSPELGVGFAILINAESNVINKISSQFWLQAHQLLNQV